MIQYASVPKNFAFNIRSRKDGDRYTSIHGQKSKVKNLFITAHIPQQLKGAIPIIELNGEIVWLSGWRIADKFQISDMQSDTQNVVIRVKKTTIY
jgi:tRNA(Ile)-lysidine synthetase-like protein